MLGKPPSRIPIAKLAANSRAIGKKSNAADCPRPRYHRPQGVMQDIPRDPLHELNGKLALRSGIGCKAQKAAMAVAIASIGNAADRRRPQMHTAR